MTPVLQIISNLREQETGYEAPGDKGNFECANCLHYERYSSSCGNAFMMEHSKISRLYNSTRVIVHPEGCCPKIERVGMRTDLIDD